LAIPSTLQDSLMERLDRLAPVKEIAQIGAAIGREFPYGLLEAISPIKGAALRDALGKLIATELVYGRGEPPDASYTFKHALVQDTAYASLLRSRRQRIHADIAQALVEQFADHSDTAPAMIAHHYTEAGMAEPAARHWLAAAELALSRSAHLEAERHTNAGLGLITHLRGEPERRSLELALLVARANSLLALKGYAAPETVAALTSAKRHLDVGIGTDVQRFSILYGLCFSNMAAARVEPTLALARQFMEVADRQEDTAYRLVGYRLIGNCHLLAGRHREAVQTLQQAEQYRDHGRQKLLSYRFALDPGFAVLNHKIRALSFLGLFGQAARVREQVLSELPGHGHAGTVATCKLFAVITPKLLFGDIEESQRESAELIQYCADKNVEQVRLWGALLHACAGATLKPTDESIRALRDAMDAHHRSGGRTGDTVYMCHLAEALLKVGSVEGAADVIS
jgi:hypothetical protein